MRKLVIIGYKLTLVGALILFLTIFLRVFIISSFKIPTPSMTPAILPGDYILVNKLIIGPRLFKNFNFLKGEKVETFRLPGFRKIKRNDILVFNFPYSNCDQLRMDINVYYLKRCIAIPGDTFYIDNGFYHVKGCNDTLGNYDNQLALSRQKNTIWAFRTFPYEGQHYWTMKTFGPLYIPKANDVLSIDTSTIALYKRLIEYETDKRITVNKGDILLDKQPLTRYRFRRNYYLMAGDNVFDSRDSRFWGLLPDDHIVGKAMRIWKSVDPASGKLRYDRLLRKIK